MKVVCGLVSLVGALSVGVVFGETFTIDPKASQLEWVGRKTLVKASHSGTIGLKSGSLTIVGDKITSGSFVVDMSSLAVTDIADPKSNAKLRGHLQSDDFFNAPQFPEATFELIGSTPLTPGKPTELKGKMTIKGVTQEETVPATITMSPAEVKLAADFKLNRTRYNVKFGSQSFFKNLVGDRIIADEFEMKVRVVGRPSTMATPSQKPADVSTKKK